MREAIQETMKRSDIFVHFTSDFPLGIDEYVRKCPDGYDVYISDRLCGYQRKEAYEHALIHIIRGEVDEDCSVSSVEWGMR